MKKKLLITGGAGFISFFIINKVYQRFDITAIDNFNSYYDVKLKRDRAKKLRKIGVKVLKFDINNFEKLNKFIRKNEFNIIIHMAAQAGVRYSLKKPQEYISSNIVGTFNLLESIKNTKIDHLLIASTSSVYGESSKVSYSESDNTDFPVSLYAATKKSIENIAYSYSYLFNIKITVFRFFTVYGPWGRPDMAIFNFTNSILNKKPISIFNYGNNYRDFTYVEDIATAVCKFIKKIPSKRNKSKSFHQLLNPNYRIVNIGNNKAIKLIDFVKTLEMEIGKNAIKKYLPSQPGDVKYTLADTKLLKKIINFKPNTSLKVGIKKFYDWYKVYYKIK